MQITIAMSGRGTRFQVSGYTEIKPLIKVDGVPMIEHVIRQFPEDSDFLFICAKDHLEKTPLEKELKRLAPMAKIIGVDSIKKGPVWAALQAMAHIKDDESILFHYCDCSSIWDFSAFEKTIEKLKPAGCVHAYRGFHPHMNEPNKYATMVECDGWLGEIREKHSFSSSLSGQLASTGAYFFESGKTLKEIFKAAVNRGLLTNDEFYSSVPFNLLVEQGKRVLIHEVCNFMHWGNPEDLEDYQKWSDYFRTGATWKPTLPVADLQVLVPMAGAGARFRDEGILEPKPLVKVSGVPMVQRSLDSYPVGGNWVCVMREEDAGNEEIASLAKGSGRNSRIITLPGLTQGQACTCLAGIRELDPEKPLLIVPCDSAITYDEPGFHELSRKPDVDCILLTFRNHTHANRNPDQYGWVVADSRGRISRISCKKALGPKVMNDPGITGAFWFRKVRYFQAAAEELLATNRRINNEFYVDSVIGVLLEQGLRAHLFDIRNFVSFGVPSDVRIFEFWEDYFRKSSFHPYGKN